MDSKIHVKSKRICVLELLVDSPPKTTLESLYYKKFMSPQVGIIPISIAVWCRKLGYDVQYLTYCGQKDLLNTLSNSFDLVFISSYTQASNLAYAISKRLRSLKIKTVLGGPHAKAFPLDALRFFDIVVSECNKSLIKSIVEGDVETGKHVSSPFVFEELPSVQERNEYFGLPKSMGRTIIPIYSSVGCPFTCNFCVDAKTKYITRGNNSLQRDLKYIHDKLVNPIVLFHDPNFGVKFNETLEIIESINFDSKIEFGIESTISNLSEERMIRLAKAGCVYIQSGIESWSNYSDKSKSRRLSDEKKFEFILSHFKRSARIIPALQGNLIFGTDNDFGRVPVEYTKKFIKELPSVWTSNNIPTPYGGTPMFDELCNEGRVLKSMPFSFYYTPYICWIPKNYSVFDYIDLTVEIFELNSSLFMNFRRLMSTKNIKMNLIHVLRSTKHKDDLNILKGLKCAYEKDDAMRSFHAGESSAIPMYYISSLSKRLGKYFDLLDENDIRPSEECFI